jgi:hypothetical protein
MASCELTEEVLNVAETAAKSGKLRRKELHIVTALCKKLGIEIKGHKAALCRAIYKHYGLELDLTDVAPKTIAPSSSSSSAASPAAKDITAEDVMEAYENKKTAKDVLLTQILANRNKSIRAAYNLSVELEKIDRNMKIDVDVIELHAADVQTMTKRLREYRDVETALEGYRKLVRHSGSSSGTDRGCPICYESYDDVENVEMVYPLCGHVCCCECTAKMRDECPVCRTKSKAIKIYRN